MSTRVVGSIFSQGVRCSNPLCVLAPKEGVVLLACKGCHLAFYCGRPCQKADWGNHQIECKKAQAQDASHLSAAHMINTAFQSAHPSINQPLQVSEERSPPEGARALAHSDKDDKKKTEPFYPSLSKNNEQKQANLTDDEKDLENMGRSRG